jgi:3',5'-nucleoside bisphosphate phosphatase
MRRPRSLSQRDRRPSVAMTAPRFDLQSHSVHSDGALSSAEVVAAAAATGVELLAVTDHDTTAGVSEAQNRATELGIDVISAVEITSTFEEHHDLHVLGYLVDSADPGLEAVLARSRADRERRVDRMADALRELGFELNETALAERSAQGRTIGRPHLAQAVVDQPENGSRLEAEGVRNPTDFLVRYLIEGQPAFRPREAPTVHEAIALIHDAGGLAVWAHPFWDIPEPGEVLKATDHFCGGLDGVEAFYVTHTEEQTRLLAERCQELDLLTTGSSDFHGPEHRNFSRFRAFSTYGLTPALGPLLR